MTKQHEIDAMPVGDNAKSRLISFIERIERLEEEKRGLIGDIKEIYSEAKGAGFDTKTIRKVIARRKLDREKREEEDHLVHTYEMAIEQFDSMME